MKARYSRDPRRSIELRRLAYKAKRSNAWKTVLHDALLETFPEYEDSLRRADQESQDGIERLVFFIPDRMIPEPTRAQRLARIDPNSWPEGGFFDPIKRKKRASSSLFAVSKNYSIAKTQASTLSLEKDLQENIPISGIRTAIIVYRTRGFL